MPLDVLLQAVGTSMRNPLAGGANVWVPDTSGRSTDLRALGPGDTVHVEQRELDVRSWPRREGPADDLQPPVGRLLDGVDAQADARVPARPAPIELGVHHPVQRDAQSAHGVVVGADQLQQILRRPDGRRLALPDQAVDIETGQERDPLGGVRRQRPVVLEDPRTGAGEAT